MKRYLLLLAATLSMLSGCQCGGQVQELWSFPTERSISSNLHVSGEVLYFGNGVPGTEGGSVFALNKTTGEQVWKKDVVGHVRHVTSYDQLVYCVVNNKFEDILYALNKQTGAESWTLKLGFLRHGAYTMQHMLHFEAAAMYVLYADDFLHIDRKSGKIIERYESFMAYPPSTTGTIGNPIWWSKGTVYIDGYVEKENKTHIYAVDFATKAVRWTHSVLCRLGEVSATESAMYFACGSGNMYALSLKDGTLLWKKQLDGLKANSYGRYYAPNVMGDTIYFSAISSGYDFYVIDAKTGAVQWKTKLEKPLPNGTTEITSSISPVLLDGDKAFVMSKGQDLVSLDLKHKLSKWLFSDAGLQGGPFCQPPVKDGNTLYFGTTAGNVYALGTGEDEPQ